MQALVVRAVSNTSAINKTCSECVLLNIRAGKQNRWN